MLDQDASTNNLDLNIDSIIKAPSASMPMIEIDTNPNDQNAIQDDTDDDVCLVNSMLPKELIFKIFSFLDIVSLCRCAQVSRYWNQLALDPINWQNISLFSLRHKVKNYVIRQLAERYGDHIRRINLRGCKSINDSAVHDLAKHSTQLEEVSLDDCNQLTDDGCIALTNSCHNLVYLNLASSNITDKTLINIGKNCKSLKLIDISNCNGIRPSGIKAVAQNCVNLVSFICVACGSETINDESLRVIGTYCQKLKLINLNGCYAITDVGIAHLASGCHQLVNCCLSKCQAITDQSLASLGQGCSQLRTLGVNDCMHLSDVGFESLAQNCKFLENLDLEDCALITDQTLYNLTKHCPNLKRLALSHCDKITDEGIKHIGSSLTNSDSIQYLELDCCTQLTDTAIEHLLTCKHLKRLDIYDNIKISHQATKKLYTYLPQVEIRTNNQNSNSHEQTVTEARPKIYRCCTIL